MPFGHEEDESALGFNSISIPILKETKDNVLMSLPLATSLVTCISSDPRRFLAKAQI